jgi:hypothetical protein
VVNRKRGELGFRMSVTVKDADYPALCEVLRQLPVGRRRVSRLLTLAHVGALFERTPMVPAVQGPDTEQTGRPNGDSFNGAALKLSVQQLADLEAWGG